MQTCLHKQATAHPQSDQGHGSSLSARAARQVLHSLAPAQESCGPARCPSCAKRQQREGFSSFSGLQLVHCDLTVLRAVLCCVLHGQPTTAPPATSVIQLCKSSGWEPNWPEVGPHGTHSPSQAAVSCHLGCDQCPLPQQCPCSQLPST